MAKCPQPSKSSNVAELSIAREECLGRLPTETAAIAATGEITLNANPADGTTVTVGATVYTFGTGAGEVANNVSITNTAQALAAAIAGDATGAADGAIVTVTASDAGEDGNALVLATTSPDVAVSGATLADGAELMPGAQWFKQDPNSFGDFGANISKTARSTINAGRQRKKGRTTGKEPGAAFNHDFTRTSLSRFFPGLLFADAYELPTTNSVNDAYGVNKLVSTTAAIGFSLKTSFDFLPGQLVSSSGFSNASNNGIKTVTAVNAVLRNKEVQVTPALVDEVLNTEQEVQVCGQQFALGDVSFALVDEIPSLVSTAFDFTTLPALFEGVWVYLGDDDDTKAFADNGGFARVKSVDTNAIVFDVVDWVPTVEVAVDKEIRIYMSISVKNEKSVNRIVQRSYNVERTLGVNNVTGQIQAEYMPGSVASELSIELPAEEKVMYDLSFMSQNRIFRDGSVERPLLDGERFEAPTDEEVYNTSSDLVMFRIALSNPASATLEPLIGYVETGSITLTNNVSANKALSVVGTLDYNYGDLEVGGSLEAYFQDVAAPQQIEDDVDAELSLIAAYDNYGMVIDMPALTMQSSGLSVEKDASIKLPIENMAVENDAGYTMLYGFFPYLPTVAMPTSDVEL